MNARNDTRTKTESPVENKSVDEKAGNFLHSVGGLRHIASRQIADIIRHLGARGLQLLLDRALPLLDGGEGIGRIYNTAHTSSSSSSSGTNSPATNRVIG